MHRVLIPLMAGLLALGVSAQRTPLPANSVPTVTVPGDRGLVVFDVRDLPASAPIRAFVITQGALRRTSRTATGLVGGGFPSPSFDTVTQEWIDATRSIIGAFSATAADGSPVELRIRDASGREFCRAAATGTATCTARIPHDLIPTNPVTGRRSIELFVEAELRRAGSATVRVDGLWNTAHLPANEVELQSGLTTTPTGTAAVSLPFVIRRNRAFVPEGYALAFRNADGATYREALALVQRDGSAQSANLAVEVTGDIDRLELTTTHAEVTEHRKLVFLVPGAGADMTVRATTLNTLDTGVTHPAGTLQDLELSLHRWSRDPSGSDVLPVPATRTAEHVIDFTGPSAWPNISTESLLIDGDDLSPGLWYAVPRSKTGIPVNVGLSVSFGRPARPVTSLTGHYFNPDRPGHGFMLAPAGNDWVLIWYTYDDEGRPLWYYAQGPRPSSLSGGAFWSATLYRNVWTGTGTRFQFAGIAQIATLSPDRLVFVHLLNGQVGAEPMTRLGDGRCTQQFSGQALDVNGLWFSPSKSGYGYSIEFIGGTEFYLAYAYDAAGLPRWVTAQQTEGARTLPLWQVRGSCPSCPPVVTTREQVGTFERTLGTAAAPDNRAGFLSLGLDVTFANGLAGRWLENRPAALLSQRAGCGTN